MEYPNTPTTARQAPKIPLGVILLLNTITDDNIMTMRLTVLETACVTGWTLFNVLKETSLYK